MRHAEFQREIDELSKQLMACVEKIKSSDTIVSAVAKQKLAALQRGLGPEQRKMIEKSLATMEKRS